jgi:hypothetical protein
LKTLWIHTPILYHTKAIDYFDFTYEELFKTVEELVDKDKVKLGKYTFIVKRREFKEIYPDNFSSGIKLLSE